MSRKIRVLKKRYAIFCEGDTEYNYTEKMRKNQGVELVLKPINMRGGGYSNFLRQIKKESQSNYLAKFIIVDADRIQKVQGERENFLKLLEYCKIQNNKGNTAIFVITNNPDFEYVACLHDNDYNGQDTKNYIEKNWKYKDLDSFKNNTEIYDFLNSGRKSFVNMLETIRNQEKLIKN
ncbi:RloB-like protein [Succinivibrio dextrinosolvens]|uniref:RloB domain-containing protein n=1 Tax=Succinivibrio dextrinosolvens TaxID=83771 RepID=UPI0008E53FDC|nr:RloB domain-containing protein [Succinivibrio dextrinosolvens]SFS72383.1 RloB-like protein [Succinivibrio dextrinosolvens]